MNFLLNNIETVLNMCKENPQSNALGASSTP
jgi:hypothetical protein